VRKERDQGSYQGDVETIDIDPGRISAMDRRSAQAGCAQSAINHMQRSASTGLAHTWRLGGQHTRDEPSVAPNAAGPLGVASHNTNDKSRPARNATVSPSPRFEIANVLLRLDHIARIIVNANHGIV
jgi:hypothetical protein